MRVSSALEIRNDRHLFMAHRAEMRVRIPTFNANGAVVVGAGRKLAKITGRKDNLNGWEEKF